MSHTPYPATDEAPQASMPSALLDLRKDNFDPHTEITKTWSICSVREGAPISLRALSPKGAARKLPVVNKTFTADVYPDVAERQKAFETAAISFNENGYNCFIVMNPIKSSFGSPDCANEAVNDNDIECRTRILIDLDRVSDSKAPATDEEILEANAIADEISGYLHSVLGVHCIRVMSGNGIHLYLPLDDVPNNEDAKGWCQALLLVLADRFNTDAINIDTIVYNASRITKVPGTIARKYAESPERPFRMARVL